MKVLLLHDIVPDGAVAGSLTAAGHQVVRCSPSGTRSFPCIGLEGRCPLDGTVDVAIVVHGRPTGSFAAGEVGAVCALRDGIPVVVAGTGAKSPLRGVATAIATNVHDVAPACERAVHARNARLGRVVGGHVHSEGGAIRAVLPAWASTSDVVRAHQMLSDAAPTAHSINVSVTPS